MNKSLSSLASRLMHKYGIDLPGIDALEEEMPPTKREIPGEDREIDKVYGRLAAAWAPFYNYIADNNLNEEGDHFIIDIDFMNEPNKDWDKIPKLSKSEFFHTLLEFVKALQGAFPRGHVTLHNSNFKEPNILMKLIKVIIPKENI